MYGGQEQVLYRPLDSNWAFGVDANWLKQRDWRSAQDMMKFTDYSVKTGHLTAYWNPSFAGCTGESQRGSSIWRGIRAERWRWRATTAAWWWGLCDHRDASPDEYGEGDFTRGVRFCAAGSVLVRPNPRSCGDWLDAVNTRWRSAAWT